MKRIICFICAALILFYTLPVIAADISLTFNGKDITLPVQPFIENGEVLVPFDKVFELLGASHEYMPSSGLVVARRAGVGSLTVGKKVGYINGVAAEFSAAAKIKNGVLMVPLSFVDQSMGANVTASYDADARRVTIVDNVTKYTYNVNEETAEVLENVDKLINDSFLSFVASLYDKDSGGFYLSRSGATGYGISPLLETTGLALEMFVNLGIADLMPASVRDGIIGFMKSRQNPETGYFVETGYTEETMGERDLNRVMGYCRRGLRTLSSKPDYLMPGQKATVTDRLTDLLKVTQPGCSCEEEQSEAEIQEEAGIELMAVETQETNNLPEYLQSEEKLIAYLDSFDFSQPWVMGDTLGASVGTMAVLDKETQKRYKQIYVDYLNKKQNPDTGLWGEGRNYNTVSGAFKLSVVYRDAGADYPNADKMFESVMHVLRNEEVTNFNYIRNPIDLINQKSIFPLIDEQLKENIVEITQLVIDNIKRFKKSDGGYSVMLNNSLSMAGQNTVGGLGLKEGDINACASLVIIRGLLYELITGLPQPPMPECADKLYTMLEQAEPIVKNPPDYMTEPGIALNENFDSLSEGTVPAKWKVTTNNVGTVSIVTEKDGNKVLKVDDPDSTKLVSVEIPVKKIAGPVSVKAKIKYERPENGNITVAGMYIQCNTTNRVGTAANIIGTEVNKVQYIGWRTWTTQDYFFSYTPIKMNEWYDIEIIYRPGDRNSTETEYYVDGELMNDDTLKYYGEPNNLEPRPATEAIGFGTMSTSVVSIYVDDLVVEYLKQ